MKNRDFFPHIFLKITALLKKLGRRLVLQWSKLSPVSQKRLSFGLPWALLLVFLLFENLASVSNPIFESARQRVLKDPLNPQPHLLLARVFEDNNLWEEAFKEVQTAKYLSLTSDLTQKQLSEIQQVLDKPQILKDKLNYWTVLSQKLSAYPDAYLMASLFNYQLKNFSAARINWERARDLNPNSPTIKMVEKFYNDRGINSASIPILP